MTPSGWKTQAGAVFQAVATLGPHRGKADYDSSAFPFRTDRNRSILNCWRRQTDRQHAHTDCNWRHYPHTHTHMEAHSYHLFPQSTALFSQGHQLVSCSVSRDTHKNSSFASYCFFPKINLSDVYKLAFVYIDFGFKGWGEGCIEKKPAVEIKSVFFSFLPLKLRAI